jgi:hypothetical protein
MATRLTLLPVSFLPVFFWRFVMPKSLFIPAGIVSLLLVVGLVLFAVSQQWASSTDITNNTNPPQKRRNASASTLAARFRLFARLFLGKVSFVR